MSARANWVVSIHDVGLGDSDPFETGPYSEARARQIADGFNRKRDEWGWHATAYLLQRYMIPELVAMHGWNGIEDERR